MRSIKNVIQNDYWVRCVKYHISALKQNKTIFSFFFFVKQKVKPFFYLIVDEQPELSL